MVVYSDLFNANTLNIFCDASTNDQNKITGYGFIAVVEKNIIFQDTRVSKGTNNFGEISAIDMAVHYAISQMYNFPIINIFSDSQISLFAVRDWIFNWKVVQSNINTMYNFMNSSNELVANQQIINDIVYTIMSNGLRLNFFHQKGHVNQHSKTSMENAMKLFKKSNGVNTTIDMSIIKYISKYNSMIDDLSRKNMYTTQYLSINPVRFYTDNNLDYDQYYKQIHSNKIFNK